MLKMYTEPPADNLEELISSAESDEGPPPTPPGGIPKQWMPAWIRWPVRVVFLPFVVIDLWAQRMARLIIRPPFKQEGKCHQRGNCCYYILIPATKGLFGKLYYLWNTQILGFYQRSDQVYESDGKKVLVMGCRYLSKEGKCTQYRLRPTVCRKWPLIEYFGYPRLIKGCGFKAVLRDQSSKGDL